MSSNFRTGIEEYPQPRLSQFHRDLATQDDESTIAACRSELLAVRNPDVFHLSCMLQEPSAFALLRIKPVDNAAFVGEDLFQISHGIRFRCRSTGFVRKTPDRIDIVVLRDRLEQLRTVPRDDIDSPVRQITCIEHLVEISDDQRICFRRNHDGSVAASPKPARREKGNPRVVHRSDK